VYPGPPEVHALTGVDLTIHAGDLVAIVGPSGSGKSTLLNLMGALDRPTAGTIRLDGDDLATMRDRRLSAVRGSRIGFVFQQFHLLEHRSALDNVADGLIYRGTPASERRRRALQVLERVDLSHRATSRARQLSGGERQRVAIARAVVGDPSMVLADEPTGNLDSASGAGILDLLRSLNATGTTIIVITHDQSIADQFPRVVEILDGHLSERRTAGAPS
jgi:putative ABC transport system ATP-binding protein